MKRIKRNIYWDGKDETVYVLRHSKPADLPQLIARYRRELEAAPDQISTRYLLANCLCITGQIEEAQSEWAQVAASGDGWNHLVTEALEVLSQKPGQGSA